MHPRDSYAAYAAYEAEYDAEEARQKEALRRYLEMRNPDIEIPPLNVLTAALVMMLLAAALAYGIFWWPK